MSLCGPVRFVQVIFHEFSHLWEQKKALKTYIKCNAESVLKKKNVYTFKSVRSIIVLVSLTFIVWTKTKKVKVQVWNFI